MSWIMRNPTNSNLRTTRDVGRQFTGPTPLWSLLAQAWWFDQLADIGFHTFLTGEQGCTIERAFKNGECASRSPRPVARRRLAERRTRP